MFCVEIVLIGLIIGLEIASLGVSSTNGTGAAGIWCAIPFMTAAISTVMLGKFSKKKYFFHRTSINRNDLFQYGNGIDQEFGLRMFLLLI